MTLYKDMLSGIPEPVYEHDVGGSPKRPSHFWKVRFRIPSFLVRENALPSNTVVGSGRCSTKASAKSLAALEAILRLENDLNVKQGYLASQLEKFMEQQKQQQDAVESTPITQEITGVSWQTIPIDRSFVETIPAGRKGRLEFMSSLIYPNDEYPDAFMAAKAVTLTSQHTLPEVAVHQNNTSEATQWYANIRAQGKIMGVLGAHRHEMIGIESHETAVLSALQRLAVYLRKRAKKEQSYRAIVAACDRRSSSFGMAKLFVSLPKHQFQDLRLLLEKMETAVNSRHHTTYNPSHDVLDYETFPKHNKARDSSDEAIIHARIQEFRSHQAKQPLPVDSVETTLPYDAMVTVVRGGTGSGKTTRYPVLLSLFSPTGPSTKVMVAEPRRLACQSAARRSAYEQGFLIGASSPSPIGYAIRFESFWSSPTSCGGRTIDFCTPGVLLRLAAHDPLLSEVTHLIIDEIHERNADTDLLLAFAKQTLRRRTQHPTLPPLRIVLMSATLDWSHWETYFQKDDPSTSVVVVDIPDQRRFPITNVHLGERGFPLDNRLTRQLLLHRRKGGTIADELLCEATAEMAINLYFQPDNRRDRGSILCFLPGMDEIRSVSKHIEQHSRRYGRPAVVYLHSSLSSADQAKVFEQGQKIILSTNIAETSITIPDVKFVIDTGRERQVSLLDSDIDEISVLGSQLVTVNISKASAKQRSGRAGRVSAGTSYRLYSKEEMDEEFEEFAIPEMLRMELSQLVLHSISLYQSKTGHPLSLLLEAPDPPTETRLRQAVVELAFQGLLDVSDIQALTKLGERDEKDDVLREPIALTALGKAVRNLQVSPQLGRMLILGLALRAIDPALSIAALLSVPKALSKAFSQPHQEQNLGCSDLILHLEAYNEYLTMDEQRRRAHPKSISFYEVTRIRGQLERALLGYVQKQSSTNDIASITNWNANSQRIAALVALICAATPNIAHLVNGSYEFATRNVVSEARIHPTSVNFRNDRRAHWYLYHELRATREAYLNVTTAAAPLDLALFSCASSTFDSEGSVNLYDSLEALVGQDDWLFVADQWIPVTVSVPAQRNAFMALRRLLTYDMLQLVAKDAAHFASNEDFEKVVLFALAALEQERLMK